MGTPADGLDQSPRYLITDELKLRQVLVNLQSNCSIMAAVPAALNIHDNRSCSGDPTFSLQLDRRMEKQASALIPGIRAGSMQ